jgi:hypothetical protein
VRESTNLADDRIVYHSLALETARQRDQAGREPKGEKKKEKKRQSAVVGREKKKEPREPKARSGTVKNKDRRIDARYAMQRGSSQ